MIGKCNAPGDRFPRAVVVAAVALVTAAMAVGSKAHAGNVRDDVASVSDGAGGADAAAIAVAPGARATAGAPAGGGSVFSGGGRLTFSASDTAPDRAALTIDTGAAPRIVVAQQAAVGAAGGGATVSIAHFAFAPAEITISLGESVTWTNDDGAPHGLVFDDGAAGSSVLPSGASFSRRFDNPGSYGYHCSLHLYMTGRVVVRAP